MYILSELRCRCGECSFHLLTQSWLWRWNDIWQSSTRSGTR